jgi:short-subunit dehydrogenase
MHAYDFLQRYGPAALVTGASSGIGEAFAVLLARGGFDLVLNGRRKDRLDKLAARLRDHEGVNVTLCCEDLSTADGPQRLAAACIDLDIGLLVSNAGFGLKGAHQDNDPARLQDMLMLNCHAPMQLTRLFIPALLDRGQGGIIITSSVEGLMGFPYSSPYAASKAFCNSLAEGLWGELSGQGIDVLALCPGSTRTEALALQGFDAQQMENLMLPEEVAAQAIAQIDKGPIHIAGDMNREIFTAMTAMPRREALKLAAGNMQAALESRSGKELNGES